AATSAITSSSVAPPTAAMTEVGKRRRTARAASTAFASFVDLELAGASPAGTGFTGVAGAVVGAPDVGSPSASDPSGGTPGPRKVCSTEGTGVNVASEPATIEGTTTAV